MGSGAFPRPGAHAQVERCSWDLARPGVRWCFWFSSSGVQESVTVQTRECRSCLGTQLGHTPGGLEGTHRLGWITTSWELHFLDLLKEIQL